MNIDNKDPYAILGLLPGATVKQIRKVCRRLAMTYHPDRNPEDLEAKRKCIQIQWAYETLTKHGASQGERSETRSPCYPYEDAEDPFAMFFTKMSSHFTKKTRNPE